MAAIKISSLKYFTFLLIVFIVSCSTNTSKTFVDSISFKDTLYKTHVFYFQNGDTTLEHDTIYFSPTDSAIDTSNFFYVACKEPCSNQDIYKIYFKRDKVIRLCDSMLQVLSPYKSKGSGSFYEEELTYEHLKEQAVANKMNEPVNVTELATLFEQRLNPLIINSATSDTPRYIITIRATIGTSKDILPSVMTTYNIKNRFGDTIFLSTGTIKEVPLKQPQ
ncbi:hypothetical protein [Parafilimonas terrae]|uniref:hypothetical protein n=1 Tax=Parafilimonas terrae TaxID=1465490 RepID=UPI000B853DF9|nr:hypothetical protein [Parafilimonas terrae]